MIYRNIGIGFGSQHFVQQIEEKGAQHGKTADKHDEPKAQVRKRKFKRL
jgi:hypothetical protein